MRAWASAGERTGRGRSNSRGRDGGRGGNEKLERARARKMDFSGVGPLKSEQKSGNGVSVARGSQRRQRRRRCGSEEA